MGIYSQHTHTSVHFTLWPDEREQDDLTPEHVTTARWTTGLVANASSSFGPVKIWQQEQR